MRCGIHILGNFSHQWKKRSVEDISCYWSEKNPCKNSINKIQFQNSPRNPKKSDFILLTISPAGMVKEGDLKDEVSAALMKGMNTGQIKWCHQEIGDLSCNQVQFEQVN